MADVVQATICRATRANSQDNASLSAGEHRLLPEVNGRSAAQKSPRLAPGASFSSRNRSYLLTAILACRSVGRTIGNGGLVTTSLTQRASPPLK